MRVVLGRLWMAAVTLFVLLAPLLASAQTVTVGGVLQGANGLPAANSVISFTPSQAFYVPGTNTTAVLNNVYGTGAPPSSCTISGQFYTNTAPFPNVLYQCIYGVYVQVFGSQSLQGTLQVGGRIGVLQNTTSFASNLFAFTPSPLSPTVTCQDGGRNFSPALADKTTCEGLAIITDKYTWGQQYSLEVSSNGEGGGDISGVIGDTISHGGCNAGSDECAESERYNVYEAPSVFSATVNGAPTIFTDGSTVITTNLQSYNGEQGAGRFAVDTNPIISAKVYSTGNIASIGVTGGNVTAVLGGGANLSATVGNSTYTSVLTSVTNSSIACPNSGNVTCFPAFNVSINVTSSALCTPGSTIWLFGSQAQSAVVESVPDGVHCMVDTLRAPIEAGGVMATGGATGTIFEPQLDCRTPNNLNGIVNPTDATLASTICYDLPVMYSSGNTLTLFQGIYALPGAGNVAYNGVSYPIMGSGGTVTLTTSGSGTGTTVTGCTASGGSGYAYGFDPAYVTITGWSTAPVVQAYNSSGTPGALNSCSVISAGSGYSGPAVATVNTTNLFKLYLVAAMTHSVNNANDTTCTPQPSCQVDGTLFTEPASGAFASGDGVTVFHGANQITTGAISGGGTFQPSPLNGKAGRNFFCGGLWANTDVCGDQYTNGADPSIYAGNPNSQVYTPGRGQLIPPGGFGVLGPNSYAIKATASFGNGQFGFLGNGTVRVLNGPWGCANFTENLINVDANTGSSHQDINGYNCSTHTWTWTSAATGNNGSGAACTYSMGPSGFSSNCPIGSQAKTIANPNTVSDNTGTSVQSAWLSTQGSGQTNGIYQAYDATGGAIVSYVVAGNVVTAVKIVARGAGYQFPPSFTTSAAGGTAGTISTSLSSPYIAIASWGDSLTDGGGGYGNTPIPYLVQSYTGVVDEDSGAWGQLATQIAVRTGALTSTMTPSGGTISACASLPCGTATTVTFTTNYEPVNSYGPIAGVPGTCTSGATSIHGFALYSSGPTYTFTPTQVISSTAIASCTFQADILDYGYVPVIWAGRNDVSLSTSIPNAEAAIAAMAANKPTQVPALVLGVITQTTETTGTTNWNTITALNSYLASTYTNCTTALTASCGFLSPQAILIASASPKNVADYYDAQTNSTRPLSYGMPTVLATLGSGINNSVTTFTITAQANGTGYAVSGNNAGYWVLDTGANQEELYCTTMTGSSGSYTVSGCTRNQNGSGAFAHSSGVVANQVDTLHIGTYAQQILATQITQWFTAHATAIQSTGGQNVTTPAPKTLYGSSIVLAAPQIAPSVGSPNNVYYAASPVIALIQSTVTNMFAIQMTELDVNNLVMGTAAQGHFYWGGTNNYVNGGNITWGAPLIPASFGGTYLGNGSQPWQAIYLSYNGACVKYVSNSSGTTYEQMCPSTAASTLNGDIFKLPGSSGYGGLGIQLPGGTPTCTPQTNYTCTVASGYTLTNAFGKLVIVGNGSATTGQAATLYFSTTLAAAPLGCTFQEVGTTLHGVDATGAPNTSGFGISTSGSMTSATATFYYYCY